MAEDMGDELAAQDPSPPRHEPSEVRDAKAHVAGTAHSFQVTPNGDYEWPFMQGRTKPRWLLQCNECSWKRGISRLSLDERDIPQTILDINATPRTGPTAWDKILGDGVL